MRFLFRPSVNQIPCCGAAEAEGSDHPVVFVSVAWGSEGGGERGIPGEVAGLFGFVGFLVGVGSAGADMGVSMGMAMGEETS